MRDEKAVSWNSEPDSEESARLNHSAVIRHTLIKSKFSDPKHFERVSKKDFFPLPSSVTVKFLNQSSMELSSSSYNLKN